MGSSRRFSRPSKRGGDTRLGWSVSLLAGALAGGVYIVTAAPGLVWGDSIELAAVCASLGIAHPTGYPLFTLLGHLFTYLPFGTIPFRVTLFCALSMAAAVVCMERLLFRILSTSSSSSSKHRSWLHWVSLTGALAFAWSLGPWNHATRTEVYALQLLLQSIVILLAWDLLDGPPSRSCKFYLVSGLLGLGFAHHLLTLALLPLWSAVFWRHGREVTGRRRQRRWLGHGLALTLGLLPILYLPLRAMQEPAVSWGHPASLEGLWWTLSGGDFPSDLFMVEQPGSSFTLMGFVDHLGQRGRSLAYYLVGTVMPLAGLPAAMRWFGFILAGFFLLGGARHLWNRHRSFALPWVFSLALYSGVLFTYNIGDITDYQLGFFSMLWPVVWLGVWRLLRPDLVDRQTALQDDSPRDALAGRPEGLARNAGFVSSLALLMLPIALWQGNYALADRSDETLVDQFAEGFLLDLPPQAILLTQGDFSTATAWYLQAVVGERPDVLVFCLDFFYDDWYGEMLARRDLGGRQVSTSQSGGELGESFFEALDRLIVAPNPDTPVLIMPSPRQAQALSKRFDLSLEKTLLDADALAAFELKGWRSPQPMVFRLSSRRFESAQSP